MKTGIRAGGAVLAALLVTAGTTWAGPAYLPSGETAVPKADNWDYLAWDPTRKRVAVAYKDGVSFHDGRTGAEVCSLSGLEGRAHGTAFSSDGKRGWATHGHEVAAFDAEACALTENFDLGTGAMADAVIYDASSGRAFAADHMRGGVHAFGLDAAGRTERSGVAQIGGILEGMSVDGKGSLFVNVMDRREIARVDTSTLAETARWAIPSCENPRGSAYDSVSGRLFVSCSNSILISIDAKDGKIVQTIAIGRRSDGVAFDSKRRIVLSSNGDGTLSSAAVARDGTIGEPASNPTSLGARTLALDPESGRVFSVAGEASEIPAAPSGAGGTANIRVDAPAFEPSLSSPGMARMRISTTPGTARLRFYDPAR